MSEPAIQIEQLGKRYALGPRQQAAYRTLRDTLNQTLSAPFRRLRSPRRRPRNDAIWALRNVSLEVAPGEVVGIVGRNGAGKSTLLKILSRITEPTEGLARIRGRVGSLLEVGTGFHPELSGRENIYLSGAILGMSRREIDRKLDEMVAFAEIDRFIDTPVKRYSSGMVMRLAFSVAAHLEPEILMIDEVLAVGDAAFQKKCLGKMENIAGHGRTVLFVSHNMPAVTRLCSRAVLLSSGEVIADGPAAEVVARYTAGVAESSSTRSWTLADAPGGDDLRVLSVSVTQDGKPVVVADVTRPIELRIGYHVATPGLTFRCSASFFTQGVCAFGSVEPRELARPHPGEYESALVVPANLLSEGEYTITISIFSSRGAKKHYAAVRDALAFMTVDPLTGDSARGDYSQNLAGVVRPLCRWELRAREEKGPAESALAR